MATASASDEIVKPPARWVNWLLAIALVIGFMALGTALISSAANKQARQDRAAAMELHTVQVMLEVQRLMSALQDIETGERGYLLTGDAGFLAPYHRGRDAARAQLAALTRLIADNPAQQARLAALRLKIAAKLFFVDAQVARVQRGATAKALAATREGTGKATMDAVRREVAGLLAAENRLLALRRAVTARADADARRAFYTVIGLGMLLLASAVAAGWLALRNAERARADAGSRAIAEAVRDQLEVRVAARTRDLEAASAQVRQLQKMDALGQLTGGIAHDFNNMLAIIISSLDLAKLRLERGTTDIGRYIDYAMEGANRAATLTQRLLAFSRQQPLAPTVLGANALVANMSELLRQTLGERIALETVLAGGLWQVKADAGEIENALVNLAVNGRDAMPDGGRLTIETANVELDDRYAAANPEVAAGHYVMIAVTDTGTGMTEDVAARAFDPFFTTKAVGNGTGLGLSQLHGFVRQSRGHVKIYSEIGRGTSVKLYLPRWFGDAPAASVAPAATASGGETVLVVEDDAQVRGMTVEAVRELGYRVLHAASGEAALQQLEVTPDVALLFTDIVMPGMNGRALADAAQARWPGLRVLYTTGYTRNAVVHDGTLDPGTAFIAKPFSLTQLAAKLRQVLDA